jgi:hypothetical protein
MNDFERVHALIRLERLAKQIADQYHLSAEDAARLAGSDEAALRTCAENLTSQHSTRPAAPRNREDLRQS